MGKTFYEMIGVNKDEWNDIAKYLNSDIVNFLESCFDGGFDGHFIGTDTIEFNRLVRLIKISLKATNFFEHFPCYSEEDILKGFSFLPLDMIDLFTRAYGEDLKHPICRVNLSNIERRKVDNSFSFVSRRIAGLKKKGRSFKNIFEIFPTYSEEEIWDAFYRMSFYRQETLALAYGESLREPRLKLLSQTEKNRVRKVIYNVLAKRLQDKTLGNDIAHRKSLFEFFPYHSKEEVLEVFGELSDSHKELIRKAFGDNLDDSSGFELLSLFEKKNVYDVIRNTLYKKIGNSNVFTGKKPKNVFEHFSDYSEEQVWDAFGRLSIEHQQLLKKAYGENLRDPSGRLTLSDKERRVVGEVLKENFSRRIKNPALSDKPRADIVLMKSFFEYFPAFSKDEVMKAFSFLPLEDQSFVKKMYGENLDNVDSSLDGDGIEKIRTITRKIRTRFSLVSRARNVYEYFPDYSMDEVYKAFLSLKPSNMELLVRAYGEDLSDSSLLSSLDASEKKAVYRIISTSLKARVTKTEYGDKRKVKSVFELLSDYPRGDVYKAFDELSDDDKKLIVSIYGTSLEDMSGFYDSSFEDRRAAYGVILSKMVRIMRHHNDTSPSKKRVSSKKTSSRRKTSSRDDVSIITSSVVKDTLYRDSYKPLSDRKTLWYMKKLKLSYYHSSELDEDTRNLYFNYYCEVTPRFQKKYTEASSSEKEALLEEAIKDSKQFRDEYLRNNHRLILRIINKMDVEVSQEELFQEGFIGMMSALEKYDFRIGARFSTYANYWIWQAVSRFVSKGSIVKTSVHFYEKLRKFNAIYSRLYQELQREPTVSELVLELDTSEKEINELMRYSFYFSEVGSLDVNIYEDEKTSLYEVLSDGYDFTLDSDNLERLKFLKRIIETSNLDTKQIMALYLRYGILDGVCYSTAEVAEKLGISLPTLKVIHSLALKKLKNNVKLSRFFFGDNDTFYEKSDFDLDEVWQYIESRLDEVSFKIFVMVYVQDMDLNDVSEQLDIPFQEVFNMSIEALRTARRCAVDMQGKSKALIWV